MRTDARTARGCAAPPSASFASTRQPAALSRIRRLFPPASWPCLLDSRTAARVALRAHAMTPTPPPAGPPTFLDQAPLAAEAHHGRPEPAEPCVERSRRLPGPAPPLGRGRRAVRPTAS